MALDQQDHLYRGSLSVPLIPEVTELLAVRGGDKYDPYEDGGTGRDGEDAVLRLRADPFGGFDPKHCSR